MSLLSSPRRRRRLLVGLSVLALGVPLVYLGVHFSTPGDSGAPTGGTVAETGYEEPQAAPFKKEDRRAVSRVLKEFVGTAVVRRNEARSWNLTAPSLREGFTRKQWSRGDMPVVPYPAADRGLGKWSFVEYSYRGTVGLEVFLFPRPGSGYAALTADVELVKGRDGKWRVDYWMPKKFHGPPALSAKAKARAKAQTRRAAPAKETKRKSTTRQAAPPEAASTPKPSRVWWLLPIGLLSLIVLAPLSIGVGVWYRNRRAERDYLRSTRRV